MNPHYDKNSLILFLYEELPANELQAVKEHLSRCNTCQRELTLLQETLNVYRQLPQEVPPREILSNMLTQKKDAASPKSRLQALFEFLFSIQPRRWVIVPICGILIVVAVAYFSNLFLPSKSLDAEVDLAWKSSLSDSLEVMSRRISLLQKSPTPLSGTTPQSGVGSASTQTIEAEISALNKQIKDFSTSLSHKTF